MITVRVDDVLTDSKGFDREKIIRQINKLFVWLNDVENLKFIPTILVSEIQDFPEAVELVKTSPYAELHGFQHVNYGELSREEIENHLKQSIEWFEKTLDRRPKVWYTPWGSWTKDIGDAAFSLGFDEVQSLTPSSIVRHYPEGYQTSEPLVSPNQAVQRLESRDDNFIVFCHWYDRGLNLRRIAEMCKHGPIQAKKINKEWW
jgi:peptidoglycan/xylan/chitin deacetylase (PgdA/CDA1 family)